MFDNFLVAIVWSFFFNLAMTSNAVVYDEQLGVIILTKLTIH